MVYLLPPDQRNAFRRREARQMNLVVARAKYSDNRLGRASISHLAQGVLELTTGTGLL